MKRPKVFDISLDPNPLIALISFFCNLRKSLIPCCLAINLELRSAFLYVSIANPERKRETERQTDRETDRQRERERERDRQRQIDRDR